MRRHVGPAERGLHDHQHVKDSDGDGIPDFLDCTQDVSDNLVVDPAGVLAAYLRSNRRYTTLQAAVNAAADNDVISMYANTTENVIIGNATGSGGKDLRIIGCGHKITSAAPRPTFRSSRFRSRRARTTADTGAGRSGHPDRGRERSEGLDRVPDPDDEAVACGTVDAAEGDPVRPEWPQQRHGRSHRCQPG